MQSRGKRNNDFSSLLPKLLQSQVTFFLLLSQPKAPEVTSTRRSQIGEEVIGRRRALHLSQRRKV